MFSARELWCAVSTITMTALSALVLTACAIGIIRWPDDPPAPVPDRAGQWAREERDRLAAELVRERAAHLAARVELDRLRRSAIWFPARGELLADGDRIPPQRVPAVPAGGKE